MSTRFDDEASPSGNRSPILLTVATAPGISGSRSPYVTSILRTISALIASGSSGTPATSCR